MCVIATVGVVMCILALCVGEFESRLVLGNKEKTKKMTITKHNTERKKENKTKQKGNKHKIRKTKGKKGQVNKNVNNDVHHDSACCFITRLQLWCMVG